jgi:hypothetical protein
MFRQLALGSLAVLAVAGAHAAELEAVLELPAKEFIRGEPILATGRVVNVSGGTLLLALGEPDGFDGSFSMERADGGSRVRCREQVGDPLGVVLEEFPAGAEKTYRTRVDCGDTPGDYVVRFVVSSSGSRAGPAGEATNETGEIWSGVVESAATVIRVREPEGEDRLAFDALGGNPLAHTDRVIAEHPASTYAGYAILDGGPWRLDPVAEVELRGSYLKTAERDPAARSQMERREATQERMSRERVRLLESYLEARPDFVYADFMRLELATRLAYLGETERARGLCARLRKEAEGTDEAIRAAELLAHLD